MKFRIERSEFLAGLYLAQGIVEKRSTIPILSNVLICADEDGVMIAATDQEIAVRRRCAAAVEDPGAVTTAARKLYDMMREFPEGEVEVSALDNKWIETRARRSRFRLVGLDPAEFPGLPNAPAADAAGWMAIERDVLEAMIERTLFAVSTDESRPTLNGICVESVEGDRLRMVATDGHRLAMITRPVEGTGFSERVIVPRKAIVELRKVLESAQEKILVAQDGGLVHVRSGPVDLSMRLVAGDFPDYRQVIPKSCRFEIEVPVDDLRAAIRRVAIVSSEKTGGVRIDIGKGKMELSSINPDVGEAAEEIEIAYGGPAVKIGFNARYLQDVLQILPTEAAVYLGLNSEDSPGLIRQPDDPDYLYIVMPMRI